MSADLWAAFGNSEDATSNPWSQQSPRQESNQSRISPSTQEPLIPAISEQQNDQLSSAIQSPWGEEATFSPAIKHVQPPKRLQPACDAEDEEEVSWTDFARPEEPVDPWAAMRQSGPSEVLFDAEQIEPDEDDFGNFEDPTKNMSSGLANVRLPGIEPDAKLANTAGKQTQNLQATVPEKHVAPKWSARSSNPSQPQTTKKPASITKPISLLDQVDQEPGQEDEEWDEWSPRPPTTSHYSHQQPLQPASIPSTKKTATANPTPTTTKSPPPKLPPSTSALPPTNIPPPSVLISLLTSLLPSLASSMSNPSLTPTTLSTFRVAGRIIAGRKNRWKRDTHLSASMRIGPASAGAGKGGMKISGLDRNLARREGADVDGFLEVWRGLVGGVRMAVASVNARAGSVAGSVAGAPGAGGRMDVPTLGENMVVKVLSDAVKSVKGCALCGLKREERVEKVDAAEVFDGFDEFWVEHWGHTECRAFWYQYEKMLLQR